MAKVDIWMPIYISDYLRDTEELSGSEHGAYLLLLMHYWVNRGEIGCDVDRLARVCRSDVQTCSFILGYYFSLENGNYRNKRADAEMIKAENRREASSENGKKGGRPSINNLEKTYSFPVGIPRENLDHNLQESSSSSSSPINIISKKVFKKPTIEEIKAYCDERKNSIDPHRFFDHYESTGWKVGKNPMKDWQAAIRTWEKNAFDKPSDGRKIIIEKPVYRTCPKCSGIINNFGFCKDCGYELPI